MKNRKLSSWLNGEIDIWNQLDSEAGLRVDQEPHISEQEQPTQLDARELQLFRRIYPVLAGVLCLVFSLILILTVSYLPRYGQETAPVNNEVAERYILKAQEETGAVNIVAGMILDYRAFDTLGESHVLFTALCAVMILLMEAADPKRREEERREEALCDLRQDPIVREIVRWMLPCVVLFGIYVILNGHISPGGGFSGGAIIGAGLILHSLAFGFEGTERLINFKAFRIVTLAALMFYSCAKGYSFFMGAHHMHTGIPLGTPGDILSSGLILPLNIAVGLVVSCTMYGIYSLFKRGRI